MNFSKKNYELLNQNSHLSASSKMHLYKTTVRTFAIGIMAFAITLTSCSKENDMEVAQDLPQPELNELSIAAPKNEDSKISYTITSKTAHLIVDNFSDGQIDKLTFEDATVERFVQSGNTTNIIGGFRQIFAKVNQNPFQHNLQLSIKNDLLAMTYGYDTRGTTYLNYGVDEHGLAPLNRNLSKYNYLKVAFDAKSTVNGFYVALFTGTTRATYSTHVEAREGTIVLSIPLSEIEANAVGEDFTFSDIDCLRFQFDSRSKTGCNMAINKIWFE